MWKGRRRVRPVENTNIYTGQSRAVTDRERLREIENVNSFVLTSEEGADLPPFLPGR